MLSRGRLVWGRELRWLCIGDQWILNTPVLACDCPALPSCCKASTGRVHPTPAVVQSQATAGCHAERHAPHPVAVFPALSRVHTRCLSVPVVLTHTSFALKAHHRRFKQPLVRVVFESSSPLQSFICGVRVSWQCAKGGVHGVVSVLPVCVLPSSALFHRRGL